MGAIVLLDSSTASRRVSTASRLLLSRVLLTVSMAGTLRSSSTSTTSRQRGRTFGRADLRANSLRTQLRGVMCGTPKANVEATPEGEAKKRPEMRRENRDRGIFLAAWGEDGGGPVVE